LAPRVKWRMPKHTVVRLRRRRSTEESFSSGRSVSAKYSLKAPLAGREDDLAKAAALNLSQVAQRFNRELKRTARYGEAWFHFN